MAVDRIKAYRETLRRKRHLEFNAFANDDINDEDLLRGVNEIEAQNRSETSVYSAAVVKNLKEERSKIGCFVVAVDNTDYVIGSIPERCIEQTQMYVVLKALQLYGNSLENLVIYITCSSVVDRVNDAIEGKVLDNEDGVQQIVEMATKIGFHTHRNASEKHLKIAFCASVKDGKNSVPEFEENTPRWWILRCERLALRSLRRLNEFKRCNDK